MKYKSLLVHLVLSGALVFLLFGDLIKNLNHVYFSQSGDGFRTYFGINYHVKYDTTSYRLDGMNYPFGEMMEFTDCQPPVANIIRFISRNISDITDYTTGIVNGLMLFSFFLASIFLFLILRKMNLPSWYASLVSLCIVFLSPQIQRIGGHFSLGWMFWIPLSIYLLMVFDQKRSFLISFLICLLAYFAGAMHYYFLAFWVFLFVPYWLFRWIWRGNYQFKGTDLVHLFIQVILPLVILKSNLMLNDIVTDRTANPWGFYQYRGQFPAVFLPLFKSYVPFLENLSFAKKIEWEAFCYVGIVASIGFFILFFKWLFSYIKQREAGSVTGEKFMDFLFWVSFLVLLFSFGLPFTLGLDKLRQFIGPIGQLRGVARFGWLFYYVINIVVFHKIYVAFYEGRTKHIWKRAVIFLLLGVFAFEAWSYSGRYQRVLNNTISELDGPKELSLRFFCKSEINPSDYQAVLPLPYFHIGSESIWLEPECEILKQSFIVSMETGLPNIGVAAARTSISQAYKNVELIKTPWIKYRVIENYRSMKPLLLTVINCDKLTANEMRLVENAKFIGECQNLKFYALSIDSLKAIPGKCDFPKIYRTTLDSIEQGNSKASGYVSRTGNLSKDEGNLQGVTVPNEFLKIMEAPVKFNTEKKCYLRFWIRDYDLDLVARTQLIISQTNSDQNTLEEIYTDIFRNLRALNNEWALIEIPFDAKQPEEVIKLNIKNPALKGENLFFDEFSVSQIEF